MQLGGMTVAEHSQGKISENHVVIRIIATAGDRRECVSVIRPSGALSAQSRKRVQILGAPFLRVPTKIQVLGALISSGVIDENASRFVHAR